VLGLLMIGIIAQHLGRTIVAVGPTRAACEHIIASLLADDGVQLKVGEELHYATFDPGEMGGMLIAPDEDVVDMDGWTLDGWGL